MTGLRAPVPDPLDAFDGSTFLRNAVLFTRALRSAGVVTDLGGALDFARALTLVDVGDRTEVYAAGSAIFCRRRLDLEIYDAVFDQFWRGSGRFSAGWGWAAPGGRRERGRRACTAWRCRTGPDRDPRARSCRGSGSCRRRPA